MEITFFEANSESERGGGDTKAPSLMKLIKIGRGSEREREIEGERKLFFHFLARKNLLFQEPGTNRAE